MVLIGIETARCNCEHRGGVQIRPSQDWVTIDGRLLLVEGDLDHRPIVLCRGGAEVVGVTRCRSIATVDDDLSHSHLVAIDGRGVVLSTASGTTDWSSVAIARWTLGNPGQLWVAIEEE